MCGIAGLLAPNSSEPLDSIASRMAAALTHRGPDDQGMWSDAEAGVVLAHRRLSVIDVSPLGHQPMHSATGRFVVAYNGEIYNFEELRRQFRSLGMLACLARTLGYRSPACRDRSLGHKRSGFTRGWHVRNCPLGS